MLQLFNNIILIIHYLGFVILDAPFCFKATRPLIYQLHVVNCLVEKVKPAGNSILSFSDLLSAILYTFPRQHKLYPITLTSKVLPLHKGQQSVLFGGFLSAGFVSSPAQPWEDWWAKAILRTAGPMLAVYRPVIKFSCCATLLCGVCSVFHRNLP